MTISRAFPLLALAIITLFVFTGCKSTPRVDWTSRVGNCTYDQAISELGPPDKTAKLSDGSTVAEWVTGRTTHPSFGVGLGTFGRHTGVSVGQSVGGGSELNLLRLTFGPDGVLRNFVRDRR